MINLLNNSLISKVYAANEITNKSLPTNIQEMTPATGLAFYIAILWRSVVTLGGVAFIIFLIWGGIEWLTAGGDKTRVETAQKMITNALIGLVVLVASYAIASFFQNALKINILAPVFQNNITQ